MDRPLRVGTRGSALARAQSALIADRLQALGRSTELVIIRTLGDRRQGQPLEAPAPIGVFTKELQEALLRGEIDLAVHSLKDLPTEPAPGLVLAALPTREDPADVLVSQGDRKLDQLPPRAAIGTGSIRRQAQMRNLRPDLELRDLRGNVDTRLAAVAEGRLEGAILAAAGLRRLGLEHRIAERLEPNRFLPAPGQGSLAVETRADDRDTRELVSALDHAATRAAVTAERELLAALSGGCLAPIGAWGRIEGAQLALSACVLAADGSKRIDAEASGDPARAAELGRRLAAELLNRGAGELIAATRG